MNPQRGARFVALATCREWPTGDEDAPLLTAALATHSIDCGWFRWDDPDVDWGGFGLTVIRSTWDYTNHRDRFLAWVRSTPRLRNPGPVLSWNSDKTYLRDLARTGLPTVATDWVAPGRPFAFPATEFVLKPTIGAGSKGAGRFDPSRSGDAAAARAHLDALRDAGRTVMVQPYLEGVDLVGEAALIYLGGRFSHAVTKQAMLAPGAAFDLEPGGPRGPADLYVPETMSVRDVAVAERGVGDRAMAYLEDRFGDVLYARIDLLPGPSGPVIVEVEVTEPSLFLAYDTGSAERFATAIVDQLRRA